MLKIDAPRTKLRFAALGHRWREWWRERLLAWHDCRRLLHCASPYRKTWALIVTLTLPGTALSTAPSLLPS